MREDIKVMKADIKAVFDKEMSNEVENKIDEMSIQFE